MERGLRGALKLYFEKPELVALAILAALIVFFSIRTNGLFISVQNRSGRLGVRSAVPRTNVQSCLPRWEHPCGVV
jgi:hypothetical protein